MKRRVPSRSSSPQVRGLPKRQWLALTWRYGLDDAGECSLTEVAQRLGCSLATASAVERAGCQRLARMLMFERGQWGVTCLLPAEAVTMLNEPCYTEREAARLLGHSPKVLRKKARRGHLPGWLLVRRERGKIYPKAVVDALVAQREQEAYYTRPEAMRVLGCGYETLRQRVMAGKVPAVLLGAARWAIRISRRR